MLIEPPIADWEEQTESLVVREHQDLYGVVLMWVGDRVYHHQALLRAAVEGSGVDLGVLEMIFKVSQPAAPVSVTRRNVLHGKLTRRMMLEAASRRGITLSQDQEKVLSFLNAEDSPVLLVNALAGSGKSTIASLVVEVLLKHTTDFTGAVAILVPSRQLRDESALAVDFCLSEGDRDNMSKRVLWLGRDKTIPSWEVQIDAMVTALLAGPITRVKDRPRGGSR